MRTKIKWNNYVLFFFILLQASLSCNDRSNGGKKAQLIGDPLYVLFTDKATFLSHPNGTIVFSFVANSAGKITLHGWNFQGLGNNYQPPALELKPGLPSPETVKAGLYLGTVYLRADRKNNIDALLNQPEANYVAFVPDPIGTNTSVTYSIWVVKDDPSKVYPKTVGTLGDTNFDANPSPPKGYAQ